MVEFAHILVIWTAVAGANIGPYLPRVVYDWRPIGQFASKSNCEKAAAQLGLKPESYRCLEVKT